MEALRSSVTEPRDWAACGVTCSFVGVTCSFVGVTCSFVGVTCSFDAITFRLICDSKMMNIATHIQWRIFQNSVEKLRISEIFVLILHITAICIQAQTANFFMRLFMFYDVCRLKQEPFRCENIYAN